MRAYKLTALVILTSGFINLGASSADDLDSNQNITGEEEIDNKPSFRELASKAENTEYHVEYTLEGRGPLMYNGRPEIYSYQGVRKVSRDGGVYYNVYYKDNHQIDCFEKTELDNTCDTLPTDVAPSIDHYDYRIDRFNITHLGERSIINRSCQMFELRGDDFINSKLNICLDNEKGFASLIEMKTTGNHSKTAMKMKATDYNMEVSSKDVKPPVNAVSWLTCDGKLNITATRYSGEVKFNLNGEDNKTAYLESWTTETFNVSESMEEGLNTATVYAGETSDSSDCRSIY